MTNPGTPPGWANVSLDQVAEVRLGRQRSPKNHTGTQMRPYLRAANLTWDGIDTADVKEMNFTDDEVEVYRLQAGDVLLSEASGSAKEVGKPGVWRGQLDGDICFQNTLIRVRPEDGIDSDFLYYRLLHEALRGGFVESARGVGIHHLGSAKLAALRLDLPPEMDQKAIAAVLDDALVEVKRAERAGGALRRRIRSVEGSVLNEALLGGTRRVPLSDLVDRVEAGKSLECLPRPATDAAWGIVKVSAMTWGEFRAGENKAIPPHHVPNEAYEIRANDVLVSRANTEQYVGAPVLVGQVRRRLLLSDKSLRLVPASGVDPRWLVNVLRAPATRKQVSKLATGTKESMRNISQKNLLSVLVPPVPPLEVQVAVAARVEAARAEMTDVELSLARLLTMVEAMRRALLRAAMTGVHMPPVAGSEPAEVLVKRIEERRQERVSALRAQTGTVRRTREVRGPKPEEKFA